MAASPVVEAISSALCPSGTCSIVKYPVILPPQNSGDPSFSAKSLGVNGSRPICGWTRLK